MQKAHISFESEITTKNLESLEFKASKLWTLEDSIENYESFDESLLIMIER